MGRVAERAKQTPGMSSVGVRRGGTREVKPKWQSGSLCVGVDGEHIHVCLCVCVSCMIVIECHYWISHSAILCGMKEM